MRYEKPYYVELICDGGGHFYLTKEGWMPSGLHAISKRMRFHAKGDAVGVANALITMPGKYTGSINHVRVTDSLGREVEV